MKPARSNAGLSKHPYYARWKQMMARCYNPSATNFAWYGARGIAVCDAWHDAAVFLAWCDANGSDGLQIDRINNLGDYSPDNCHFVTRKRNMRNTSQNLLVQFGSELITCKEASERLGLRYTTFYQRIAKLGWSDHRAVSAPLRSKRRKAA